MKTRVPFLPMAAAFLLLLTGCGSKPSNLSSSGSTPGSGSTSGLPATTLYVVQNDDTAGTSSVLEFSATASGSVLPTASISPSTGVQFSVQTFDTAGNLYVAAQAPNNEIFEYAPGATGAATPIRTITSMQAAATALAIDATGQIYVGQGSAIAVYAADATANAVPLRRITGGSTLLSNAYSIAVNSSGDIYVANSTGSSILVFSPTANGNVAPNAVIGGNATGIGYPFGLTFDTVGNLYATTEASAAPGTNISQILEFAASANGNAVPTRSLTAVSQDAIAGISVDGAGNIYVITATIYQLAIQVFSASASSSVAPRQIITSPNWYGSDYGQIAVR